MRIAATAALACLLAHPAWALCDYQPTDPKSCVRPSKLDPRMVTAAYDPAQVYALHIPQGQTLVVTLGATETAIEGYGADKSTLLAYPSGNAMFFISGEPGVAPRPIFIRSRLADGTMRTYCPRENPRLCRGGCQSLTFPGVCSSPFGRASLASVQRHSLAPWPVARRPL